MLTPGQQVPSKHRSFFRRLVLVSALTGGLLVSAPDVRAEAYPDAPTDYAAPVCDVAPATVIIDGGDVTNTTTLDLSADGGTAIGDASGGDDNLATTGDAKEGKDDKDKGKGKDNDKSKKKDKDREKDDKAETASAGNGGSADASADGGAIAAGDVNSGGNVGSAIAVGDTFGGYGGYGNCGSGVGGVSGGVFIDGGTVTNETIITVSADGGTAIADASGGDGNIASTGGRAGDGGAATSSAGNGGVATASADGGVISLGDINSGGNAGNAIGVGDTFAAPPICCAPAPPKPIPVVPIMPPKRVPAPAPAPAPGKVVVVTLLPSTGTGPTPASANMSAGMTLLALTAGAASVAARRRVIGAGYWVKGAWEPGLAPGSNLAWGNEGGQPGLGSVPVVRIPSRRSPAQSP